MVKVIGYKVSSGTFTPDSGGDAIDYDNLILYVVSDEDANVHGQTAGFQKIPRKTLTLTGAKSYDELIGKEVWFRASAVSNKIVGVEVL